MYDHHVPVMQLGSTIKADSTAYYVPAMATSFIMVLERYFNHSAIYGYEHNISFAIPLSHVSVEARLKHLIEMPTGKDDGLIYQGVCFA